MRLISYIAAVLFAAGIALVFGITVTALFVIAHLYYGEPVAWIAVAVVIAAWIAFWFWI